MVPTIDYYIAPQSPYVYLGNERLREIVRKTGATVRLLPMDLGRIFPASGGLPLNQRAPQRLAYRLLELKRFSRWNKLPLNMQPAFFPVNGDDAARLLIAVDREDGSEAALRLLGAMGTAVWAEERNLAEASTLEQLLASQKLPGERLEQARSPHVQQAYVDNTAAALDAGVFGAPSFVVAGELFWGQDRLDFVERRLKEG